MAMPRTIPAVPKPLILGAGIAAAVGLAAYFALAPRLAADREEAAAPEILAGPAFLPDARRAGDALTCVVDLAKVAAMEGLDEATSAQFRDLADRARLRVQIDGRRMRSEMQMAGLMFVSVDDGTTGTVSHHFPAGIQTGAPEGCEWMTLRTADIDVLRAKGAAGQFAAQDPVELAPADAFTCEPGGIAPDAFETEPSCDGLPVLCGWIADNRAVDPSDEDVRRLCGGDAARP
jgi:hypothetical protein